jgi:hypothetical protein
LYPDGVPHPITVTFTGVTYNGDGTVTIGITGFASASARAVSIEYGWDLFPGRGPQIQTVPLVLQPDASSVTIPAPPDNIIGGDVSLRGANTDHPGDLSYIIDFSAFTFTNTGSNFTPAWYNITKVGIFFTALILTITPEGTTANPNTLTGTNVSTTIKGQPANMAMKRYTTTYNPNDNTYRVDTDFMLNMPSSYYLTISGYADDRNVDGFFALRFVSQWNF